MQIAVIAKEPRPGRVKTRLSPPFTPAQAAQLAAASLDDTLRTVAATPAARRVLVLDGGAGPWVPDGFEVIQQRGGGLGDRLAAAVGDCAATCTEPVVVVGMDTPQVTTAMLLEAGAVLAGSGDPSARRAVIGPADDGGYWLIGLSHPDALAFDGVTMSAATTGAEQVEQLHRRGFAVRPTRSLRDVDTVGDALHVAEEAPGTAFARCLDLLVRSGEVPQLVTHV